MKLIIIDDEIDFCKILQIVFIKKGFEVFLFHSLAEGMKAIDTIQPNIVILDNNLPDGKGWENCIRLSKHYPTIQFHLISAFEDNITLKLPAHNHKIFIWQKPMRLEELANCF